MDGFTELPHGGRVRVIAGDNVLRRGECADLCARLENYWHSRGYTGVQCRPVAKEYRGHMVSGERLIARYWEVSSVGIPIRRAGN